MTIAYVPWPSVGDDSPFPGSSMLAQGERKVYHCQLLQQWHPDKFSLRLVEEEHLIVLKRVTAVFQSINNDNDNNNNNGATTTNVVVAWW